MRKLLDVVGRAIAYLGVCIILGERPAAWSLAIWSRAQMERAKRDLAEREATLNKMIDDAMRGAGKPPQWVDYTELPALTGPWWGPRIEEPPQRPEEP